MKKIEAVIEPFRLAEVQQALWGIGLTGMTAIEVRGFGRRRGHTDVYRGVEYIVELAPQVKVELVLDKRLVEQAADAIRHAAKIDRIGSGDLIVYDLQNAVRIRTGETGANAL